MSDLTMNASVGGVGMDLYTGVGQRTKLGLSSLSEADSPITVHLTFVELYFVCKESHYS